MSEMKTKIWNVFCAICCLLVAGAVAYMIYTDRQEEAAQTALAEELQAEARPYENQLQELRSEWNDLENSVSYSSEEARLLVGFLVSEVSDISYIEEKAVAYDFVPVLVLDCTEELTEIEALVEAADADWEIMLYASGFSEDVNDEVLAVMAWLDSVEREYADVFFLRDDFCTTSNLQLLQEDGFIGYTSYHSASPTEGQTDEGMVYFDYSYLTTSGTSVTSRISALYSGKTSMLVVFDMASINSGALSEAYVTSLLDTMQGYAAKEDCSFSTVAETVQRLSEVLAIEEGNQKAYEEQAAELQEQIEALEETIADIYARLEY